VFLSLPRSDPGPAERHDRTPAPRGSPESARRLYAMSESIAGTIAAAYLRARRITALPVSGPLRFHPRCYYRPDADSPTETWPALIAAVTDLTGRITGAHRTWLDPSGHDKAPVGSPRRAMGPSPRAWRAIRCGERRHRGRRRNRNHAVAAQHHADHADGGGALGQSPCRPAVSTVAAPSLYCPRRRSSRRPPRWRV